MDFISPVWMTLLPRLALWLIWLVAVALAIRGWSRHPRASLMVLLAVAIFFINSLISWLGTNYLNHIMETSDMGRARLGALLSMFGAAQLLFNGIGWGFVVAAIFLDRGRQA